MSQGTSAASKRLPEWKGNMIIRHATLKDVEACFNLANIPELEIQGGGSPPKFWFEAVINKKQIFLVAEENKNIIGFRMGERIAGNIAFAHLFVVKEEYRNKGIGSMLSKAFEKECKKRGINLILCNAYAKNRKTLNFFRKQGYMKGSLVYELAKKL